MMPFFVRIYFLAVLICGISVEPATSLESAITVAGPTTGSTATDPDIRTDYYPADETTNNVPSSGDAATNATDAPGVTVQYEEETEDSPLWMKVFDKSQLVMVLVGLVANFVTIVTLFKNGTLFSVAILTLLRHQSIVDALTCTVGALTLIWPYMWVTGNRVIDLFVCHVWHSQAAYWLFVCVSIWNLVAIAFERYLAVCHPFKHGDLTRFKIYIFFTFCYFFSAFTMIGSFLQVRTENGVCVFHYFIRGDAGTKFFAFYGIYSFMVAYFIPCIMFFVLYGMVIYAFKKRQKKFQLGNSRVIDKATAELTKMAVVVTGIFIVAIGYDLWYYILGRLGVVLYEQYTPVQKIGVWLSAFNSVANPFVYALLMPAYRRSVYTTFCGRCNKMKSPSQNAKGSGSMMTVAGSVSTLSTRPDNDEQLA